MIKAAAEIGLNKKMESFPSEMIRDWRKFVSNMGPRIKAMTRGASS